jgi:hypothetical protein
MSVSCPSHHRIEFAHSGCWWYCFTPSIVKEITQMRIEMLGVAFTAQHSDARVLDQLSVDASRPTMPMEHLSLLNASLVLCCAD